MFLVTKSSGEERRPDETRYSSDVLDFVSQANISTANELNKVLVYGPELRKSLTTDSTNSSVVIGLVMTSFGSLSSLLRRLDVGTFYPGRNRRGSKMGKMVEMAHNIWTFINSQTPNFGSLYTVITHHEIVVVFKSYSNILLAPLGW